MGMFAARLARERSEALAAKEVAQPESDSGAPEACPAPLVCPAPTQKAPAGDQKAPASAGKAKTATVKP